MSRFQSILCVTVLSLLPIRLEGAKKEPRANIFQQTEALTEVAQLVKRQYYREADQVDLYHGAIKGYLSKLDPHSTYITPEQLRKTHERLEGAFEGIGIYFDLIDKFLTVLSPIDGSPAHKVGILAGDRVYCSA